MKRIIFISAVVVAYHILHTGCCFSQGTAINSTGAKADNSAMLDVSDTTKGILIPRMKKVNKLAISNPANGLLIYQTDDTTGFWYYNSVKWVQATGTGGTFGSPAHYPGELYGGGVVFWVDETGNHGLICSMIDLSTGIVWTKPAFQTVSVPAPGAVSDWNGQANTDETVAQAGADNTFAAGICYGYTNADYGTGIFSDWYLPCRGEMNDLWNNIKSVQKTLDSDGNSATTAINKNYYWSSSEYSANTAWAFTFYSGDTYGGYAKDATYYVRAVRIF